jgi:hypothetical protein
MSVQCLVDPDEAVELLAGVGLVDPDVPLVPVVPVVPVVPALVLVLVVVAASATSAPPAIRPLVSAPMAITFRRRNLMVTAPFVGVTHSSHLEEQGHLAGRSCGSVPTRIKPR